MSDPGTIGSATFPAAVGPGSPWSIQAVGDMDGDSVADWTGKEFFVLHIQHHLVPVKLPMAGVECVALEWTGIGCGDLDYV